MAMSGLLLVFGLALQAAAQAPDVHYLHQGAMPPGAIGSLQLQRGGPVHGFFQPVEIKAPRGVLISLATEGTFDEPRAAPTRVGMLIGQVYRLRVTNIPLEPGREVFPTVEVIDRLYTPRGQQQRFAIPVQLTLEDIRMALDGKFVTRVIYLEDPQAALPVRQDVSGHNWFEARPGQDPLAVADGLGRPVAILRLGARMPSYPQGPDMQFLYGCPPFVQFPARPQRNQKPQAAPPEAAQEPAAPPPSEPATAPDASSAAYRSRPALDTTRIRYSAARQQ
jgi:hypothetical protein